MDDKYLYDEENTDIAYSDDGMYYQDEVDEEKPDTEEEYDDISVLLDNNGDSCDDDNAENEDRDDENSQSDESIEDIADEQNEDLDASKSKIKKNQMKFKTTKKKITEKGLKSDLSIVESYRPIYEFAYKGEKFKGYVIGQFSMSKKYIFCILPNKQTKYFDINLID